jgi:hypothetical protein
MKTLFSVALVIIGVWLVSCQSTGVPLVPAYPWAGCGLDSFVQYKMIMPDGQIIQEKQVVIEVKPGQVLIESLALSDYGWLPKGKMIVPLNVPRRPPSGAVGLSQEHFLIAGKTVRCNVMEGNGIRVWMSEDVPGGLVKQMSDNTVLLEVVDFRKK